ncbi:MAG: UDP-N-acetylmuramoyl-tripeptide--D-alanyl-D-alanine ligase [Caldilineales bacterium]
MKLRLSDVVSALSGTPLSEGVAASVPSLAAVEIDSRKVQPGSLFIAFPGEHTDGHRFVSHAFSRGAAAALIDHPVEGPWPVLDLREPRGQTVEALDRPLCLLVDNTLAALQQLATWWRSRFTVQVVGITGSVGKTTTKEITAAVLRRRYVTLKSAGNLNNEIGLPLTLLQLDDSHQRAVLEMGMYALGEIAQLCRIARPRIGVVTNVGPVHLERLGTIERVAEAKSELVQALPADGVAVLNADEPLVAAMRGMTAARVFTYGLTRDCDLWADEIAGEGLDGIRFRFHYGGDVIHVKVPLLGRHSVHTALRAAAVGLIEGLTWEEIVSGLQDVGAQLRLVVVRSINGATLLDDTYNASPASMLAALNLLQDMEVGDGRRIAVLGDMMELGSEEEAGHRLVGARAADVADYLVTVGPRARWTAYEARAAGQPAASVRPVETAADAIALLRSVIGPGDVVLVKGSRAAHMDDVVAALAVPSPGQSAREA